VKRRRGESEGVSKKIAWKQEGPKYSSIRKGGVRGAVVGSGQVGRMRAPGESNRQSG